MSAFETTEYAMNLKNRLIAAVFSATVLFAAGTLSAADWYVAPNATGGVDFC